METLTFRVVSSYVYSGAADPAHPLPSCENCGHEIRNIYVIADQTDKSMMVGSECVKLLVARENQPNADKMIRRMERAAAQWRKKTPPSLPDETREQYINRRVVEMGNALQAHKAYRIDYATYFEVKGTIGHWSKPYVTKVIERAARLNISKKLTIFDILNRHRARIAKRYNANSFDFTRPSWDVPKI